MQALILAPSCSGKTHFTNFAYGSSGVPLIDGDDVISATVGWIEWQRANEAARAKMHRDHAQAILDLFLRNKDASVVFHTDIDVMVPFIKKNASNVKLAFVVLTNGEYARNVALRAAAIARGESSHKQPKDKDVIQAMAAYYRKRAPELGVTIYPSFVAAARALHLYVSKRYR